MHIDSLLICRANGKVYEKLRISDLKDSGSVIVAILGDNMAQGEPMIPARLYRIQDAGVGIKTAIAVYPIMPVKSGTYSIAEFSDQGKLVAQAEHRVEFDSAKWKSRINYRTKRSECEEIRLIDEREADYGDAAIKPLMVIGADTHILVRIEITRPLSLYHDNDGRDDICCINIRGEQVPIRAIQMGSSTSDLQSGTTAILISHTYSVSIPWNQGDLYLFASVNGKPETTITRTLPQGEYESLLSQTDKLFYQNAHSDPYYAEWLRAHRPTPFELDQQRAASFATNPLFSIVVPLYNTPLSFFKDMVASVTTQTYQNWELILVNASPENAELSDAILQAQMEDGRIVVETLAANEGISLNTNAGIRLAKGGFTCFLDHDDLLEPNALFEYAKAINQHPDTDLIYCDEDKLDPSGTYINPYFKPDFSIDLLRNNNYICHFLSIRKSLLETLPPNTRDYDGAQDYNLILHAVEHARRVKHVPKVLYHWRISETSTAGNADDKPYATEAGIKALKEHFERVGLRATVQKEERPFTYKVFYDVPQNNPLVSIIIPSKDHIKLLDTCLSSISKLSTYRNFEIVIVENNSTEKETFEYYDTICNRFSEMAIMVVTWEHEFNFSKIVNYGAQYASGEYLILLNNDTEVITPNWIEILLGIASREDVGAVGAKLLYPDDTLQHAGVGFGDDVAAHYFSNLPRGNHGYYCFDDAQRNVSAVTAACMMTKTSIFNSIGGFNQDYAVAYNDVDYCLRLRAKGCLITYTPEAELYHYESVSRGFDTDGDSRVRYIKELARIHLDWASFFAEGDPYFTPNLRRDFPEFCYYRL